VLPIPLRSQTPDNSLLAHSQSVLIVVAEDKWMGGELSWSLVATPSDTLPSPGTITQNNAAVWEYVAPALGEGEVIISVTGVSSAGEQGFARLTFAIK
jgi:hypothetical protein